jgi:RNA polymerase sigma-70 factor (ECF subfamily)
MNQTAPLLNLQMATTHRESDWMSKLKSNENKTLKEIYTKYRGSFTQQIKMKYCLQDDEAKEIFQLCMIVFYDNVMTGKLTSLDVNLKSYLMGIARNKIHELYRAEQKSKKSKFAYSSMLNAIINPVSEYTDSDKPKIKAIIDAIQRIGDPCRSILHMFYYQNKSIREITTHFHYKNENTTKTLKYKCIQRIKKQILL